MKEQIQASRGNLNQEVEINFETILFIAMLLLSKAGNSNNLHQDPNVHSIYIILQ